MEPPSTTPRPGAAHRRDVQGLRALAVLLVVVHHTGVALPGGFVGVDVFFVVSGYVIVRGLLPGLEAGEGFSPSQFWARRVRRILPSLAVVVLVGVLGTVLLLNPYLSQDVALGTAGWGTVFAANAYLYRHTGYFDATSDGRNPFLHLWSLSVEEQFYVALPLVVLVGWRVGRRRGLAVAVGALSAASFGLSWALTSDRGPVDVQAPERLAYYASPTRAWELGAGVLLALAPGLGARLARAIGRRDEARVLAAVLAGGGVVAIAHAAITLAPLSPFPGLAAVPVVLGTVAILLAGDIAASATRPLTVAPLRWIGDRSYTWYLWHWPAIVLASVVWPASTSARVAAAGASLVPAALVYRWIEHPLRRSPRIVGRSAVALAAVCVLVPGIAVVGARAGMQTGWGVEEPIDWYDVPAGRGRGCLVLNRDMEPDWPEAACTTAPTGVDGPAAGTVLVIGDSHADSVSTAAIDVASARGLAVAQWARTGCPVHGFAPAQSPRCERWQHDALALVDRLDPELVVIANRSTAYTTAVDDRVGSGSNRIEDAGGGEAPSSDAAVAAWEQGLFAVLSDLGARGVPVVVVAAVPGYPDDFPRDRVSVLRPDASFPQRSRADVDEERAPVVEAEQRAVASAVDASGGASGRPAVAYVDPIDRFCTPAACSAGIDGRWAYSSAFELTNPGSRSITDLLARAVDEVLGPR